MLLIVQMGGRGYVSKFGSNENHSGGGEMDTFGRCEFKNESYDVVSNLGPISEMETTRSCDWLADCSNTVWPANVSRDMLRVNYEEVDGLSDKGYCGKPGRSTDD